MRAGQQTGLQTHTQNIIYFDFHENNGYANAPQCYVYSAMHVLYYLKVVSRQPLTVEVRVRSQINPCGICGRKSSTGTGFSSSNSPSPCQRHSVNALYPYSLTCFC
jgi:hypothetical protein